MTLEIDHLKETISSAEDVILDLEEEKENSYEENKNFQTEIESATKTLDKIGKVLLFSMTPWQ